MNHEVAGALIPGMAPLDDPALWEDDKAGGHGFEPKRLLNVAPPVRSNRS